MQVDCSETDPFVLDTDQQLGRIEVFNSLAVIAPQIELDRMRTDRRYNVSSTCTTNGTGHRQFSLSWPIQFRLLLI